MDGNLFFFLLLILVGKVYFGLTPCYWSCHVNVLDWENSINFINFLSYINCKISRQVKFEQYLLFNALGIGDVGLLGSREGSTHVRGPETSASFASNPGFTGK